MREGKHIIYDLLILNFDRTNSISRRICYLYLFFNILDILVDVRQLGSHIRNGEVNKAVDLSKKLAKQRVQLQANSCAQQNEEKTIQYVKK